MKAETVPNDCETPHWRGGDVRELLKDARHRIANLSRAAVPLDDPLDGPVLRRLDAALAAQPAASGEPVACPKCGCEHGVAAAPYWNHKGDWTADAIWTCDKCDGERILHLDLITPRAAPAAHKPESRVGTNTGHGHVWERPDGLKTRCGGPGICIMCSADAAHAAKVKEENHA